MIVIFFCYSLYLKDLIAKICVGKSIDSLFGKNNMVFFMQTFVKIVLGVNLFLFSIKKAMKTLCFIALLNYY